MPVNEEAVRAMRARRLDLIGQPLDLIYGELLEAALPHLQQAPAEGEPVAWEARYKTGEYAGLFRHKPACLGRGYLNFTPLFTSPPKQEGREQAPGAVDGELQHYIDRCVEMSNEGEYSWWSRLAEILRTHQAPIVKQLEWRGPDYEGEYWAAWDGERYKILHRNGNGLWLSGVGGYFATVEDAKAAAQADYERRVLSCLALPSSSGDA